MELSQITLRDNPEKSRFEFDLEEKMGLIEYIKREDRIFLTHTEVPEGLEGKGYGKAIVLLALQEVEKMGLTLVPLCSYVAAYIRKNPEWSRLL